MFGKSTFHAGSLADTSFDESSVAVQAQQFDSMIADEVIKYRTKVAGVLNSTEGVTVKELKQIEDLTPYRDWFIELLKGTEKLQQTIDSDFVQQFE